MDNIIKVLHLEDSLKDSELIHSIIEGGDIAHEYFLADNEKDFINILETEKIDIILSDYSLPDYNGNEALQVVREKYSYIPFLFVTGSMGEDAAIESLLNGATDYVLKHKLERLVPAIKRAVYEHELEIKQKLAEEALKESREMLRNAQKLAKLGVWDWKVDGDIVTCTEELYQIAGRDPKLSAHTFAAHASLYTPQSWYLLKNNVENTMKTSEPFELELEIIRPDGSIRNVVVFGGAKYDIKNQIIGLYGTVQDITERKQDEKDLKESKEQLSNFASNLQLIIEEERVNLAREIHDSLAQFLVALKIDMGLYKKKIAKANEAINLEEVIAEMEQLMIQVDVTYKSARNIINGLRPEQLELLGFVETVEIHLNIFEQTHHINCSFKNTVLDLNILPDQAIALFRILQESLNNILKHAMATTITVQLSNVAGKLVMEIIDNGVGFDVNYKGRPDSYGLIGMKERIKLLGGNLDITSKVGEGTMVKVEIDYGKNLISLGKFPAARGKIKSINQS